VRSLILQLKEEDEKVAFSKEDIPNRKKEHRAARPLH
jgi:hypothetical protein